MNYLAFDLGGSSGKMYLANLHKGKLRLKEIVRIDNCPIEVNGRLYWDFFNIYKGMIEGVRQAVRETNDQIESIGFDSFCNDFALIDEQGTILSPIRCYRDPRTARNQQHLDEIMDPKELYMINGNQRGLFNTLPQLHAMQEENQGWMLEKCDKALFVSDLFIYCLTGKKITEYTTASVTQMFDFDKKDWSQIVLNKYGIRKSLFAPIVMPGVTVGMTKEQINETIGTKGIAVTTVCQHDTGSAFLSSITEEEHVIISAGTWSVIGCETEDVIIKESGFEFNIANEGGYEGHHRILRNVMGTWILQELLREKTILGEQISFSDLDKMAWEYLQKVIPIDVDQQEFYKPGGMQEKIENFWLKKEGKKPKNIGEIAASVYLGLVFKYRFTIEKLEEFTGKKFQAINILGGGAKSKLICQLIADVCQLPVEAGPFDATAYGNILVQMLARGEIESVKEGRKLIREATEHQIYEPLNTFDWNIRYKAFIESIY